MSRPGNEPMDRREFLRDCLRYALLSALALTGLSLGSRSGGSKQKETCLRDGACRGCPELDGCGLPRGLTARQVIRKGGQ